MPVNSTVGLTMSHGDDIYTRWADVTPSYPASELLINTLHFEVLFLGASGSKRGSDGTDLLGADIEVLPQDLPHLVGSPLLNRDAADRPGGIKGIGSPS